MFKCETFPIWDLLFKHLVNIEYEATGQHKRWYLLNDPYVLDPIKKMKHDSFEYKGRLNLSEVLIALAIQSLTNPLVTIVLKQLPLLRGHKHMLVIF